MKRSILVTVSGIAVMVMLSCRSFGQQRDTFKPTATLPAGQDLEVIYEGKIQAEKKIQESKTHNLTSVMALEGILIAILIPIVLVQRKKINRLSNN